MPILVPAAVVILICLLIIPRRKKMKEKNLAILAEAGEKLEEVPIKMQKNITGVKSFIDSNYVLFYCTTTGFKKYDLKTVQQAKLVSQRMNGARYYYLCFRDADDKAIGKDLCYPSGKQAEEMLAFVQKYLQKYNEEKNANGI